MASDKAIRKLEEAVARNLGELPSCVDNLTYRRSKVAIGAVLTRLADIMFIRALGAYYIDHDVDLFKQHCYVSGRAYLMSAGQEGGEQFSTSRTFFIALLSDCPQLIEQFSYLSTPDMERDRKNPRAAASDIHLLQLALKGKWEELVEFVKLLRATRYGRSDQSTDLTEFFLLLANRDKESLETLIETRRAKIRHPHPIAEDFVSFYGAMETKLCWLKEIPVEINHRLVPMDLMPVRPLLEYKDVYEFLKPGWVPPAQGPLAGALRWLKAKRKV